MGSCKTGGTGKEVKQDNEAAKDSAENGATPVTVVEPSVATIGDSVELNATSTFLLKTYVKSSANGYLQLVNAELNRYVEKGQEIFVVKTKEAQSLGNTITSLDTSFHFNGVIHIKAPGSGFISQLNYRSGDYVQDGEQLATITDSRSLAFILALPYELKPYLADNRQLQLRLPDGMVLDGTVTLAMPTVDSVSQTQNYLIKLKSNQRIPENLIAKVHLARKVKVNTVVLPKAAVLSDETQSQFWVMKMADSTTAIKVPVQKGVESGDKVEILSPRFLQTDRILLTGNYGLGDTAKVTIIK